MRICVINEFFYPDMGGGSPKIVSELCRHLRDNFDVEIDVITTWNVYRAESDKLEGFEDWNGIKIHRLPIPRSQSRSVKKRLMHGIAYAYISLGKVLRLGKFDLVLVGTNPPPAPALALAMKVLRKTPYVYFVHDLYPDLPVRLGMMRSHGRPAWLTRNLQRSWLHNAAKIMVLGRCMRDHLIETYSLPDDLVEVATNWHDNSALKSLPQDTRFRSKHGLTGFTVLYSGNMGTSQSIDDLLDAAKLLLKEANDITIVLVGSGNAFDHYRQRIAGEEITNVMLLEPVESQDYPDLLASADVQVIPMAAGLEGLAVPSKFYPSLASGRPILAIASPFSEVARVIEESECGIRVDYGNVEQIRQAVLRLHADRELCLNMGREAAGIANQKYTLSNVASKYMSVFNSIVPEKVR